MFLQAQLYFQILSGIMSEITFKLSGNGIVWSKINAPTLESESHTSNILVIVNYKSGVTSENKYINKYKYSNQSIT